MSIEQLVFRWALTWIIAACTFPVRTQEALPAGGKGGQMVWDNVWDKNEYMNQKAALLKAREYDKLEKVATHLRKTKEKFPDGDWKLETFYAGLAYVKATARPLNVRLKQKLK